MTSSLRFDFAPIIGSQLTPEGYLRVRCRAARTGVQSYRRNDGSTVVEFRPREEVGSPASLSSFGLSPVTWQHPPVLLDAENTKQFQVGFSGGKVSFDDGFVEVALTVTDAAAIAGIQRGDATEVSAGYKVDFDPTPGTTPDGEHFDGIQRNIQVNHIAIVPKGRAGKEVRLLLDHFDSDSAISISDELIPSPNSTKNKPSPIPKKIMASVNLDGLSIELPSDAAAAVQSFIKDMERRVDSSESNQESLLLRIQQLEEENQSILENLKSATVRGDEAEAKVAATSAPPRMDTAELDALVSARLDTLTHLAPAFEAEFKFDGIPTEDLYQFAYKNLTGEEVPEDSSGDYIAGIVDGLLSVANLDSEDDELPVDSRSDSSTIPLRNALNNVQRGANPSSAIADYQLKLQNAWQKPLTATKGI